MLEDKIRLVIGITGASSVIYGIRILEVLQAFERVETHLILSPHAEKIIALETRYSLDDVTKLADYCHDFYDLAAPVSSGSFITSGMIVIPCSIKTLSGIVNSYNENLIIRAADVTLKERRRLVVVPRETPLHLGHLELMTRLTQYGGIILPPFPAFYAKPKNIQDIVDHTVGKILDLFDLKHNIFERWQKNSG